MSNIINSYRFVTAAGGFLLDTYSNGAAAWSLRKLKTGVTYGVEVRRTSDNATTDVELYETGSIDLSSTVSAGGTLGTWVGSNTATIVTWYDQSGNSEDLTNSTAGEQPVLVLSGTLKTKNSTTALDFTSDVRSLVGTTITALNNNTAFSIFTVSSNHSTSAVGAILNTTTSSDRLVMFRDGRTNKLNTNIVASGTTYSAIMSTVRSSTDQILQTLITDGTDYDPYDNGSAGTSVTPVGTYTNDLFQIGIQLTSSTDLDGYLQEIIIFSNDKSSDRTSIESDINTYYSIP